MSIQLKQEFDIVKDLRATSGFKWNDQEQSIRAPREVWDAYIKVSNTLTPRTSSREYFTDTPNGE
jgi:hypothetical protein